MDLFSDDLKAEALGGSPLFETLSRQELVALAKVTEDMEVDEGKVLAREGELGSEFFVIVDGEVSVTTPHRPPSVASLRGPVHGWRPPGQ